MEVIVKWSAFSIEMDSHFYEDQTKDKNGMHFLFHRHRQVPCRDWHRGVALPLCLRLCPSLDLRSGTKPERSGDRLVGS
jgi:hypothetical protein